VSDLHEVTGQLFGVAVLVVQPVADLFGRQAGEEQLGTQAGVRGAGFVKQVGAALTPEGVRSGADPSAGLAVSDIRTRSSWRSTRGPGSWR
jgi:hypothetical protein